MGAIRCGDDHGVEPVHVLGQQVSQVRVSVWRAERRRRTFGTVNVGIDGGDKPCTLEPADSLGIELPISPTPNECEADHWRSPVIAVEAWPIMREIYNPCNVYGRLDIYPPPGDDTRH